MLRSVLGINEPALSKLTSAVSDPAKGTPQKTMFCRSCRGFLFFFFSVRLYSVTVDPSASSRIHGEVGFGFSADFSFITLAKTKRAKRSGKKEEEEILEIHPPFRSQWISFFLYICPHMNLNISPPTPETVIPDETDSAL